MINSLGIKNFRGLENVSIKLAPFTLIAGANNVGKTSILEAVFLLYGHRSPLVFNQLLSFRNANVSSVETYDLWENIFRNYDLSRLLSISTLRDENCETLSIFRDNEFDLPRELTQLSKNDKLPTSSLGGAYPLKVLYRNGEMETQYHVAIVSDASGTRIVPKRFTKVPDTTSIDELPVVSFASDRLQNSFSLYDLLGKASRSKQKDKVVDVIKGIDSRINDIILGDKQQVYIDIAGMEDTMPLSFLGAGVSNVLYWATLILSNSTKILLIDEIENGIHYSSMQSVMEKLCEIGKTHDCQIIATTHSIDCVRSFSKCPGERIGYVRLERHPETGIISSVEIDAQLLPNMINAEWEVR